MAIQSNPVYDQPESNQTDDGYFGLLCYNCLGPVWTNTIQLDVFTKIIISHPLNYKILNFLIFFCHGKFLNGLILTKTELEPIV